MNKLAYWRSKRGLTVRELSEKSKVASATITRIETGKQAAFLSTLGKLATALDIDVQDLAELSTSTDTSIQATYPPLSEVASKEEIAAVKETIRRVKAGEEPVYSQEEVEHEIAELIANFFKEKRVSA